MKLKGKYGALVPDVTVHDVALDGQHAAGGLAVGCHTCEMDVQGGGSIVGYKRLQWPKSRGVSFIHHGDFRVAAVPESLSLLHSYLCM